MVRVVAKPGVTRPPWVAAATSVNTSRKHPREISSTDSHTGPGRSTAGAFSFLKVAEKIDRTVLPSGPLASENFGGSRCRCRPRPGACRLQRFPHALERRRPPCSHPEASQGRVREASTARQIGGNLHPKCTPVI